MEEYSEELISEIKDQVDIVEFISDYVTLHQKGKDWFGKCPFHDERTASFSVTPSNNTYYCFGCGRGGDVISFCTDYLSMSYNKAIKHLAGIAGIDAEKTTVSSSVKYLKKMKRANRLSVEPAQHKIIGSHILTTFEHKDIVEWIREGIPQQIMTQYGIAYDRQLDSRYDRIVYPVYDLAGNLINIKGRTLCKTYKEEKPMIPKYMNYYPIGDLDYFQGLNFKKDIVREKGEVIIFESFKSVMKADSYGWFNTVSSETSKINPYQLRILIGLHINVTIAFDADIALKTLLNDNKIGILSKFTNVYIVYDKNGLLGDKSLKNAPVDCGKEIWEKLYAQRIKV